MWRDYMSIHAQNSANNLAHFVGGNYVDISWRELMHPHVETQSAQEIIDDVAARAGLTIV